MRPYKFTLHDIILDFGRQVISADADFQIHQQLTWLDLKKKGNEGVDSIYYGINATEKLNVQQLEFDFNIVPVYPNFWQKIWRFFFGSKARPFTVFRFQPRPVSGENHHIKIIFFRESNGKYNPVITSEPPLLSKPEDTYVTHLPR